VEVAIQNEWFGNKQNEREEDPHANHRMHPPKRDCLKSIPKVEAIDHEETRQRDDDYRGARLPYEAPLDRLKRSQSIEKDAPTRPSAKPSRIERLTMFALAQILARLLPVTGLKSTMNTEVSLAPEYLATIELFRDLSSDEVGEAMALARVRRFDKDTLIFNLGDAAGRAHVLVDGNVRISQSGSDGAQIVMRFIAPGETYGTVALFTDGRYPAEAFAITDSIEASWSEADLRYLLGRYPQIAMNVIHMIGNRLKEAQERVRELATQRAEQRVAHALLRLALQAGQSTSEGTAITFPLRRKDVADISGTTLHTASRILAVWERDGLVLSRNQRLVIRQPSELMRIADHGSR
jgi:CRP-like cAMP-binding protein